MRLFRHIAALTAAYAVALQLLFGALAAAQAQAWTASGWPPLDGYCATGDETGGIPHHGKDCTVCVVQNAGGVPPVAVAVGFSHRLVAAIEVVSTQLAPAAAPESPRLSQGPPDRV